MSIENIFERNIEALNNDYRHRRTSIGLGDISATARNHFEMMCATLIMLLSGVMWSQVLATMTQVLATMAPAAPGKYVSYWRLVTPGGAQFGHRLWIDISVTELESKEAEEDQQAAFQKRWQEEAAKFL